jgi:UDP-N-acetylmuramoylalanine--D-glutamate ligase
VTPGGNRGMDVSGRRVVVVGGARSGVAAARLLAARGAHVTLTDVRPAIEEASSLREAGIAVELGAHDADTLSAADLVVLSPGVPPGQAAIEAARQRGVPVVGELELASRFVEGRIVAVTGTKGKSTTTALIGRMLAAGGTRVLVGGNIGVPLSALVGETGPDVVHVVEVSSFQLEGIATFHPAVAVFLNFSPDHLDRHATVEQYRDAKARVFENQDAGDHAVVNADDPVALALARAGRASVVPFSARRRIAGGAGVAGDVITWCGPDGATTPLLPVSSVRLLGRHLLADVVAAAAVAHLFGIDPGAIRQSVESFTGLEHAMEPAGEVAGVRFVNDSKATNVEAACRAIESFGEGLVVIMGGRFKGGDLTLLREPLARRRARVVAIGEARPALRAALDGFIPVDEAPTLADAVRAGAKAAPPGGTVLLAPACASFDMFRDYADRGRAFKEEVARLVVPGREV